MLFLGRWVRGNPPLFSHPSPALEASRPIVHFLGFRASPKIPTSDVCLRQAPKCSFKMIGFSFEMAGFTFKRIGFSFKMVGFSFKMAGFSFKMIGFSLKMANVGFKMANSRLQMANLGFQRGPGQELAENGPFAFKPHKEFIEKKTACILENLAFQTVQMTILASKRLLLVSKSPILDSKWPVLGSKWQIWASKGAPGRNWQKTVRLPLSRIKNLSKKIRLSFWKIWLSKPSK